MDRRAFLDTMALCFTSLLPFSSIVPAADKLRAAMLFRITSAGSGHSVEMLGDEYFRRYPQCKNETVLIEEIYYSWPACVRTGVTSSVETLAEFLNNRIAMDFDGDWILLVDGWLYARTELRLCALQHLLRP